MKVTTVTSFNDFARVLKVRHDVFIREEDKFNNDVDRMVDEFDDFPNPEILMVCDESNYTVGTMRINTGRLDLLPFSKMCKINPKVLYNSEWVTCTSMLAIRKEARKTSALADMVKYSMTHWDNMGAEWLVSTVNRITARMWTKRGFQRAGEDVFVEQVNDWITPLYIGIPELKKWVDTL